MTIVELTNLLSAAKADMVLKQHDEGLTYIVSVPFERWEIELRNGRVVRVERFISTRDKLGPDAIGDMLAWIGR